MKQMSPEMSACIQECQTCHAVCLSTAATHCLELGGKHVEPVHYRIMLDCAQICQTSADFMLRRSILHSHICSACALICRECASSCAQVGDMQDCVDACRRCAESCEKMTQMTYPA